MNKIISHLLVLGAGLFIGTSYGWITGRIDGEVATMLKVQSVISGYSQYRGTPEIAPRDRAMDALSIGPMATFANGHSYSPLFFFMHPKADYGLFKASVVWAANHPDSPMPIDEFTRARIAEINSGREDAWDQAVAAEKEKYRQQAEKDGG